MDIWWPHKNTTQLIILLLLYSYLLHVCVAVIVENKQTASLNVGDNSANNAGIIQAIRVCSLNMVRWYSINCKCFMVMTLYCIDISLVYSLHRHLKVMSKSSSISLVEVKEYVVRNSELLQPPSCLGESVHIHSNWNVQKFMTLKGGLVAKDGMWIDKSWWILCYIQVRRFLPLHSNLQAYPD